VVKYLTERVIEKMTTFTSVFIKIIRLIKTWGQIHENVI